MAKAKGRCPRWGKLMYPTEKAARAAMRYLRTHGHPELRDVYLCSACDQWHLTSERRRRYR